MKHLFLVFIGGGIGSALRFLLARLLNNSHNGVPYGTLLANVSGSLLIGIILGLALRNNTLSQSTVVFLASGFCGGYTTFATFSYENHLFLKNGDLSSFIIYALISIILGFSMVFLGMWITREI